MVLLQLNNTKTSDQKLTLLHFLVKTIEEKYPDLLSFPEELLHVEQAARGMEACLVLAVVIATVFQFSGIES